MEDLKKPVKFEGIQRIGETPVNKAIREVFVNQIYSCGLHDGCWGFKRYSKGLIF